MPRKTSTGALAHNLHPSKTGADNIAAWNALMQALPAGQGGRVELDVGTYNFSAQLDVIRPVEIVGAGGGPNSPTTMLHFPGTCHGVVLHSYYSYANEASSNRADSAVLRDVRVRSTAQGEVFHGVVVKAPVVIDSCFVDGWVGDGINMHASLPDGNASLSFVRNTWSCNNGISRAVVSAVLDGTTLTVTTTTAHSLVTNNIVWLYRGQAELNAVPLQRTVTVTGPTTFTVANWTTDVNSQAWSYFTPTTVRTGNGVFVQGGDANAIRFEGNTYINNVAWGAYDNSFLGNTHTGELADSNQIGAYFAAQANSPTAWIGCYSEASNPQSFIARPSYIVGGDHGATVYGNYDGAVLGRHGSSVWGVRDALLATIGSLSIGDHASSIPTWLQLGLQADSSEFWMNLVHNYFPSLQNVWTNWYSLTTYSGNTAFMLSTNGAVSRKGHAVPAGQFAFHSGFYFNRGSFNTEAEAVPTTGVWKRGDRVWNSLPAVGSPMGWACTVSGDFAGTPPTFAAMPNL